MKNYNDIIKRDKYIDQIIKDYMIVKKNRRKLDKYIVNRILDTLKIRYNINELFSNPIDNTPIYNGVGYIDRRGNFTNRSIDKNYMTTIDVETFEKKLKEINSISDVISSLEKSKSNPKDWIEAYKNSSDKDRFYLLKYLKSREPEFLLEVKDLLQKHSIDVDL